MSRPCLMFSAFSAFCAMWANHAPAQTTVFFTDFENGLPAAFSGGGAVEGVQGYVGVGNAGNAFGGSFLRNDTGGQPVGTPSQVTTLTLTNLPPHDHLTVEFLLAVIDTWDGNFSVGGAPVPDVFSVRVDGVSVFSNTLSNFNANVQQTYIPPAGVLMTPRPLIDRGFQPRTDFGDAAYNMGLEPAFRNIPHTSSQVAIAWQAVGAGWQGGLDESWALENVRVLVLGQNCRADFDHDGFVTGADFDMFVQAFEAGDDSADFDGDTFITGVDFDLYVGAFEAGC